MKRSSTRKQLNAINTARARVHLLLYKIGNRTKRFKFAELNLERAWRQSNKTSASTAIRYGDMALRRGDVEEAIGAFEQAVKTAPQDSTAIYKLGFALERNGEWDVADKSYKQAQATEPDSGKIAFRRGRCLSRLGDNENANAQYRIAIRGGHRVADAYLAAYRSEATNPLWKRLDTLRAGTPHHSLNWEWLSDRAFLAARMGEHAEAVEFFKASDKLKPLTQNRRIDLACSLQDLGQTTAAARMLNKMAEEDEGQARILGPGAFFKRREYWSEAIALYKWKLDQTTNIKQRAKIEFEIGHAYDRQYLWYAAKQWITKSIISDAGSAYRHYRLGVVFERLHEYDQALGPYARAVQLAPEKTHWFYRLGAAALQAGETDVAYFALRSSLGSFNQETDSIKGDAQDATDTEAVGSRLLRNLESNYTADLSRERQLKRPALAYTWQESLDAGRASSSTDMQIRALKELSMRRSQIPRPDAAEFADLLDKTGRRDQALQVMLGTRDIPFPDGLDLNKYLKNSESRRRSLFAEYQQNLRINDKLVFLESNHGASLGCHPLALFREMVHDSRFNGIKYVWAYSRSARIPQEIVECPYVILVEMHSDVYLKYLATAKYLINNVTFAPYFVRREGQTYLNTWHGTPMKTLGQSMRQGLLEYENIARNLVQATHVSSPNQLTDWALFEDHRISRYATAKRRITGSPRLDALVTTGDDIRRAIRRRLSMDESEQFVLYAPTWRGGVSSHELDSERLISDLKAMSSSSAAKVFFRAHRLTEKLLDGIDLPVEVVPSDIDTNDLLAAVDVLVTDYSSIAFDFLVTHRPIVFYTPDIARYRDDRGLYILPEALSSWTCERQSDLSETINRAFEMGRGEVTEVVGEYTAMEDGNASHRTLDFMLETSDEPTRRRPLLVFHASLIPNGIASALLALLRALDPELVDIVLVIEANVMRREEGRQSVLERLPDYVDLAFRVGEITATAEEQWAIARDSNHDETYSEPIKLLRKRAWRREARRVLGDAEPATAIEFDGYAVLWADFIANCGSADSRHLIWQHNQLVDEWRTKYPELAGVFARYDDYDAVVPVSEALALENRVSLSARGFDSDTPYEPVRNVLDVDGIRSSAQMPLDCDLEAWMEAGEFNVVSIGRLSPEKNFGALIDAWAEVASIMPNTRLTMIGSGLLEAELRGKIDELGLRSSILLAGQRTNPYPALKRADLFVLPSVHEGQPVVVLEAMALGVPVAAAYTPGTAELIDQGYGEIVDHSSSGLARALIRLIQGSTEASGTFDAEDYGIKALSSFITAVRI